MRLFRDGGDCERDYEGWMVNNHKKHGRRLRRGRRRGRYRQTQTRTRQLRGRTPDATVGHWQVLHTARRLEKRIIGIGRLDDERALERRRGGSNDTGAETTRRVLRSQGREDGVARVCRVWKRVCRRGSGTSKEGGSRGQCTNSRSALSLSLAAADPIPRPVHTESHRLQTRSAAPFRGRAAHRWKRTEAAET